MSEDTNFFQGANHCCGTEGSEEAGACAFSGGVVAHWGNHAPHDPAPLPNPRRSNSRGRPGAAKARACERLGIAERLGTSDAGDRTSAFEDGVRTAGQPRLLYPGITLW